jgi:hypothetical protein
MVLCYGSADGVALKTQTLNREKFPTRHVQHSQTFLAVVQHLREHGTFRPRSVDRSQEHTPQVLDLKPQILETVQENSLTSTWQLAREFQVCPFVVCRTEQGLHPYHVQRVQALKPNDYIRR